MVYAFSWLMRNKWAVILLACVAAAVIFKDGIVKSIALLHPLKQEDSHKDVAKDTNKKTTKLTTKKPDGTITIEETIVDLSKSASHVDVKRVETAQVVSHGGLFIGGIYGFDGKFYPSASATYDRLLIGLDHPLAIPTSLDNLRLKAEFAVVAW